MPKLILRSLEKNNTIKKTVLQAYEINVTEPESSLADFIYLLDHPAYH